MINAEIISIGNELLLGKTEDTNSTYISQQLALMGINCHCRTTVRDDRDDIARIIQDATRRSELIITGGGLGPTPDDITIESIANAFKTKCIRDSETEQELETFYQTTGRIMPKSNLKQADRPEGSKYIANPKGTAPGMIWTPKSQKGKKSTIISLPGVPHEMKTMWRQSVIPYLNLHYPNNHIISCDLNFIGIGESHLAEKFSDLIQRNNPDVATYAGIGECKLRILSREKTREEADKCLQAIKKEIIQRAQQYCYGEDNDSIESIVAELLIKNKLTLSVAESCTGGLISKRLTDIPGSSRFTRLNLISYADEAKSQQLDVPVNIIKTYGAVSPECAMAMAKGIRKINKSDIGLSVTGIAGPSGASCNKNIGLIYFGLDSKLTSFTQKVQISNKADRLNIRHQAASTALNIIRLYIQRNYPVISS